MLSELTLICPVYRKNFLSRWSCPSSPRQSAAPRRQLIQRLHRPWVGGAFRVLLRPQNFIFLLLVLLSQFCSIEIGRAWQMALLLRSTALLGLARSTTPLTPLESFMNFPQRSQLAALRSPEGDRLFWVEQRNGADNIMVGSEKAASGAAYVSSFGHYFHHVFTKNSCIYGRFRLKRAAI